MKTSTLRLLLLCGIASLCLFTPPVTAQTPGAIRMSSAGTGPFQRVAYWLAGNLFKSHPDLTIWTQYSEAGRGFRDGVLSLQQKKTDITVVNSRMIAAMAVRGRGLFQRPFPGLRGISIFPQHDWCLFAVDASLGVRSFEELKAKKIPLKLATGYPNDGIAFLALEILRRHGISREDLLQWGGEFIEGTPVMSANAINTGRANAIFQEGAYNDRWKEMARKRALVFLPLDPDVARKMHDELGVDTLTVPEQFYPGQTQAILTLAFSDFLLCVREDMADDMAYELARIAAEKREEMPGHEYFPKIDPAAMADTSPVPLHPGALRYYKEKVVR